MLILLSLLACIESAPLPYVGDCADYPDGIYDFGQIGIGRCLSGPVSMDWSEDGSRLIVANANPFLDFTGGSLLSLDIAGLPMDGGISLTHEVADSALDMPSFPGDVEPVPGEDLLLVTNRFTEGARTRVGEDALYFASAAGGLDFRALGAGGEDYLILGSDPQPIAYDPVGRRAFVLNLTDHTVSVLDPHADPVAVVDAVEEATITPGRFLDADRSGSRVDVALLDVIDPELIADEAWTLSYADGSYRLWLPTAAGIYRLSSYGDELWERSAIGYDLDGIGDTEDWDTPLGALADPQLWSSEQGVRMLFADTLGGSIRAALAGDHLGEWAYEESPLIEPGEGELLGGPSPVTSGGDTWLFYHARSGDSGEIRVAVSVDDISFTPLDGPVVSPGDGGAHDSVQAADPYVIYDSQGHLWRMFYGAWDGELWTVGQAWSEDLETWVVEDAPSFVAEDGGHAAAPVVSYTGSEFRMWTTRGEPGAWSVGLATSVDGWRWTDRGIVADFEVSEGSPERADEPPGVGLQSQPSRTWALRSEASGASDVVFQAGDVIVASAFGFEVQLSTGARLSPERAPSAGVNGVSPGSWLVDEGLVYLSLTDDQDTSSIGLADWDGGALSIRDAVLLEGQRGAFDEGGVFSPLVYRDGEGYRMLYAGTAGGSTAIGLATSEDGLTWTSDHRAVLEPGSGWDSVLVEPGSISVDPDSGLWQLWYTGSDGERTRIGLATSSDGLSWTRVPGASDDWIFGEGSPGEFDDTSVRDPSVLIDEQGVVHLWYAGFDGELRQIGYASMGGDGQWQRAVDPATDEGRPVFSGQSGSFDAIAAYRPVVSLGEDRVYRMLYTGLDGVIPRGGLAEGLDPDRLYRSELPPTVGDTVSFSTRRGDGGEDQTAIPLAVNVEGFQLSGIGGSSLLVDSERGFLYVTLKLNNYLYVIDIRDDSTERWRDSNYLDIEAVLVVDVTAGSGQGLRGMHLPEGSPYLYVVNNSPESVLLLDLGLVEDDELTQLVRDPVVGYLPTPRAGERDEGGDTLASIGPSQLTSLGDALYVANFNDNSVGVYDLRLGNFGTLVDELRGVGENPQALSISPDGRYMAVANYVGDLSAGRAASSLSIVDVDPGSPTYLETLAWIQNE